MGEVFNPATGSVAKQVPYSDASVIDSARELSQGLAPDPEGPARVP